MIGPALEDRAVVALALTDGAGVGSAGGATFLVGCLSLRPTRGPLAEFLFPGLSPGIRGVG